MTRLKNLNLLPVFLLLFACAEQPAKDAVLIPVEERNNPVIKKTDTKTEIKSESNIAPNNKPEKTETESVIVALINEADNFSSQGNTEKASASIERALRIEPRNALLWHHLARVRLQQQQWQQAIVLARKSNALAADDNQLKSDNWGLIAVAYEKLGEKDKANDARNRQTGQT